MFQIEIKTPTNLNINLTVEKSYTIRQIKELIMKEKNILEEVVLKFNGEVLKNDKTLDYYEIYDNDILYLTHAELGGGGIETVDVSKNITKEYEPGNSGKYYKQGCFGLCIQSTCKNYSCEAFNDTIYVKIG